MINNPVGVWSLGPTIVSVLILLTNTLEPLKRRSENLLLKRLLSVVDKEKEITTVEL